MQPQEPTSGPSLSPHLMPLTRAGQETGQETSPGAGVPDFLMGQKGADVRGGETRALRWAREQAQVPL